MKGTLVTEHNAELAAIYDKLNKDGQMVIAAVMAVEKDFVHLKKAPNGVVDKVRNEIQKRVT